MTRQIYTGAGKVFQTQDGVHYCISQRAQHIYQKISGTTTNDRSIINTRDEPHADREKYRRLHVIVGDSNMSEYTNFVKVATCAVVLQMIEDNFINKDFTLRHPVKAIKDISYDTTCKRKLRLENGSRVLADRDPARVLRDGAEVHRAVPGQRPAPSDGVREWQYVLDCLDDDPDQLDRQDRLGDQAQADPRATSTGAAPHLARPARLHARPAVPRHPLMDRGFYYLLERKGAVERILTDEEIEKAKTEPPQDTRARMRGDFIKLARQNNIQYDLDWSNIRLGNLLNVRVICNNPFETDTEKVTELVRTIQKTNLRRTSLSKLVIQS